MQRDTLEECNYIALKGGNMEKFINWVMNLITGGGDNIVGNTRLPKFLRYLLLGVLIIATVLIGLGFILFGLGIAKHELIPGIIVVCIGPLLVFSFVYQFIEVMKNRNQDE